jgi:catechol 2,3-dioxygenase-like lactoylglutathione lyase family enzyme
MDDTTTGCGAVLGVAEIALFTERPAEVLAFYRRLLGREPLWSSDDGGQFDLGGVKLLVHRAYPDEPGAPPNSDHVALRVADVDAAAAAQREAGAPPVAGPDDYYWGRSAYLRDPDGRVVELTAAS